MSAGEWYAVGAVICSAMVIALNERGARAELRSWFQADDPDPPQVTPGSTLTSTERELIAGFWPEVGAR